MLTTWSAPTRSATKERRPLGGSFLEAIAKVERCLEMFRAAWQVFFERLAMAKVERC